MKMAFLIWPDIYLYKTRNKKHTMKNTTTKEEASIIATEISERLVDINHDLLMAETAENYSQAAFIKTALDLFLTNSSQLLAGLTGGSATELFEGLKTNSDLIFASMKSHQELI